MRLNVKPRQRRRPSMTSLIDVIFLLLLFFMLSSTFTKFAEVEISSVKSGGGTSKTKPDLFITLSEQGWKINGKMRTSTSVQQTLATLSEAGKTQAVLQVSKELTSQGMIDALELLKQANITVRVTN